MEGKKSVLRPPRPPLLSERSRVVQPLWTSIPCIDLLTPLGVGHRVVLTGPRRTGKSTTAAMIARESRDKKVIYVTYSQTSRLGELLHRLGGAYGEPPQHVTVIHADAAACTAGTLYLAPVVAARVADTWRKAGDDVLLILDDLAITAEAASEVGRRIPLPIPVANVAAAAFDSAGVAKVGTLTVVGVVDLPDDRIEEPTLLRDPVKLIAKELDAISDVRIDFNTRLANIGIYPAVDVATAPKFPGMYQTPLMRRLGAEVRDKLKLYGDTRERVDWHKVLKIHVELTDQEDMVTLEMFRLMFTQSQSRTLAETVVLFRAGLVYHFFGKKPQVSSVQAFQKELLACFEAQHSDLLTEIEEVNEDPEAHIGDLFRKVDLALLRHRFDFFLTTPEL